jgi:hypothetical protein
VLVDPVIDDQNWNFAGAGWWGWEFVNQWPHWYTYMFGSEQWGYGPHMWAWVSPIPEANRWVGWRYPARPGTFISKAEFGAVYASPMSNACVATGLNRLDGSGWQNKFESCNQVLNGLTPLGQCDKGPGQPCDGAGIRNEARFELQNPTAGGTASKVYLPNARLTLHDWNPP